jgi:hypothetical protein
MDDFGPIEMGRKGRPLNFKKWNERCLKVLGREVLMGEHLSRKELEQLGFRAAATLDPKKAGY